MTDTDRLVVWLRETMDAAEATARATTPVPVPGEWAVVRDKHADDEAPLTLIQGQAEDDYEWMGDGYRSGLPVIAHAAAWQDEAEANLRHIALNDPAAVLRRITADRKQLAEHTPVPDHGRFSHSYGEECPGFCEGACRGQPKVCLNCRDASGDPIEAPCRSLDFLAEGYGWDGEIQSAST